MELGKVIISILLAVVVVRIGQNLRMKLTGARAEIVNSRTHTAWILVVAFFIYAALSK